MAASGRTPQDIARLKARNASGEMVPIGTVARLKRRDRALSRAALQSLSRRRGAGRGGARRRHRHGAAADGGAGPRGPAARHRLRVDRARLPATAARHADPARVRRGRTVRLPRAGRPVRELEAAARGRADRADVPAGLGHRPRPARHADRRPGPDRLRRAGRAGREERDPDRRVRAPGRGRGRARLAKPRCAPPVRGCGRS